MSDTLLRYREFTPDGIVIHAPHNLERDRTLCGYAEDGECIGALGDGPMEPIRRGKITCLACVNLINHCRSIPRRLIAPALRGPRRLAT